MKADIHPDYHMIKVVLPSGESFETRSTWGKEGEELKLDVDPSTHPAWVGGVHLRKTGRMEKFNSRFGNLSSFSTKKNAEAAEEKKDA